MFTRSTFIYRVRFFLAALILCASFARAADQVASVSPAIIQGEPLAITMDKAGTRFVTGRFMGTVDFNPGVGEDSKTSGGGFDIFVTRFEKDGSYGWTKTFGGSLIDFPKSIVLMGKTLYVGGTFASPNAGIGGSGPFACKGLRDVVIWSMDALTGTSTPTFGTGGIQIFGGSGTDNLQAMVAYRTNLALFGNFDSTDAIVGGGLGTIQAAHALDCYGLMLSAKTGLPDLKFDNDGAVAFGGSDVDEVSGVAVLGSTIYVTGNFKSMDFDYDGSVLFAPLGIRSAFVLAINGKTGALNKKFNTTGAVRAGGSANDYGVKLAISGSTLYLAGNLQSANAGVNALGTFASSGMNDAFVLALSATNGAIKPKFGKGGFQKFGGSAEETAAGISANARAIYLAGTYESTNASLESGMEGVHVAKKDIFVLTLSPKDGKLLGDYRRTFSFSLFGGSEDEIATDLFLTKKTVYVAGTFNSTNAGYYGTGLFNFTNFGGLLLPFDLRTGVLPTP